VSQQGLLACLGHSVLSTSLVHILTQGQQLSVGLPSPLAINTLCVLVAFLKIALEVL